MPIADADLHVMEPPGIWAKYVAPAFADDAPKPIAPEPVKLSPVGDADLLDALRANPVRPRRPGYSPISLTWRGEPIGVPYPERVLSRGAALAALKHPDGVREAFSPESYLAYLDASNVEYGCLHPSGGLLVLAIEAMPPALAAALARAYNDWLHDFASVAPDRLRPVAGVALQAPDSLAAEVHRAADRGWRAVTIRPNPFCGRTLGSPELEPLWQACAERNMAITLHEGTGAKTSTVGEDRFSTHFGRHSTSHPVEMMLALVSLLEGGVFARHPTLRFGLLECGAGWLVPWLWRLDEKWRLLRFEVEEAIPIAPSELFRRQCFIACEPDEPGLEATVDHLGSGVLLFGSDYPHWDHDGAVATAADQIRARLGDAAAEQVLWSNSQRLFGESA